VNLTPFRQYINLSLLKLHCGFKRLILNVSANLPLSDAVMPETSVRIPSVSANVDLADSRPLEAKNIYIPSIEERVVYPGLFLGQALVFLSEDGVHYVYVKTVSGTRNIYRDEKVVSPIPGTPYSLLYVSPLISVVTVLGSEVANLLVLDERFQEKIYEFTGLSKGLITRKALTPREIDQGFAGKNIYAIARLSGDHAEKSILITGGLERKFELREFSETLTLLNWSGEWFSYARVLGEYVEHYIILYTGEAAKYRLDRELYGSERLGKNTMVFYGRSGLFALCDGSEVRVLDPRKKAVVWQRKLGTYAKASIHSMDVDKLVVSSDHEILILDVNTGEVVFREKYRERVASATLSRDYLVVATESMLYIYRLSEATYKLYGKYSLPGTVVASNIYGEDLLVAYTIAGNILKTLHANLASRLELVIPELSIMVNTAVELPVKIPNAEVKLVESTTPTFRIVKHRDGFALADLGSSPGVHSVTIKLEIPEHLAPLVDLLIRVEEPSKALKKITIPSKPIYTPNGVHVPITITTSAPIDEIHAYLVSSDRAVYGSSALHYNLSPGDHVLPIHIVWAKFGKHEVEVHITGWSRRNKIHHVIRAELWCDKDVVPLYLRLHGEAAYLWSPVEVEYADIIAKVRDIELNVKLPIKKGWNELSELGGLVSELRVTLPTGVKCILRRGKSWIEF